MGFVTILATAIGLAMDALAVSAANGVALRTATIRHALTFGFYFGLFQFVMPLLGCLLGSAFADLIVSVDHWVAFALLAGIGLKMLWDTFHHPCESTQAPTPPILSWKTMSLMAIATSIDALAVGISFAMVNVNIWFASAVIGLVAFSFSFSGVLLGKHLGCKFGVKLERLGGCVLIVIGAKIVVDHLTLGPLQ